MFPIALNVATLPILLVGKGKLLQKRLDQLEEAGAKHVTVMDDGLPSKDVIAAHRVVMVVALSREESQQIADEARALGRLVNVEDVSDLCDFYFTANVRRGDLLIAVSTGGASPTLAKKIRDTIAAHFGEEWNEYTQLIASQRNQWKDAGKNMKEIAALSENWLAEKGWFK